MKIPLYLDTETYSPLSLTTYGTHRYAEEVEIIMWQYAIGDGEVIVEDYLSSELRTLLSDDQYEIVIHNSHFDRTVIRHATGIELPTARIFDTMACAMAHSLPGGLGQLCDILGVSTDKAKDKEGGKLINMFCKPQKMSKEQTIKCIIDWRIDDVQQRYTKETHPEKWEKFREYGRLDIEAMREVYKLLPRWNFKGFERELWELDQRINDRGIKIDLDLAAAAIRATGVAQKQYSIDTAIKTDGAVASTNQRNALLEFFKSKFNLGLDDLKSSTVRDLLRTELPSEVLDLLEIRLDASKTSASKYKRAMNGANKDGRLRGCIQYSGAGRTKRWAGRFFQPHNLCRSTIEEDELSIEIDRLKEENKNGNMETYVRSRK